MLLDDQRKFDDQMKEYSQHLKKILVEKENSKGQRKQTFLTDDYNVLSYKETSNNKVVEKSDNNNLVEVKKLMRFAKNKNNEKEIVSQEAKSSLIHGKNFFKLFFNIYLFFCHLIFSKFYIYKILRYLIFEIFVICN
jgi:hypothetical protein